MSSDSDVSSQLNPAQPENCSDSTLNTTTEKMAEIAPLVIVVRVPCQTSPTESSFVTPNHLPVTSEPKTSTEDHILMPPPPPKDIPRQKASKRTLQTMLDEPSAKKPRTSPLPLSPFPSPHHPPTSSNPPFNQSDSSTYESPFHFLKLAGLEIDRLLELHTSRLNETKSSLAETKSSLLETKSSLPESKTMLVETDFPNPGSCDSGFHTSSDRSENSPALRLSPDERGTTFLPWKIIPIELEIIDNTYSSREVYGMIYKLHR